MNFMDEVLSYITWRYYKLYYTLKIDFKDFVRSVNYALKIPNNIIKWWWYVEVDNGGMWRVDVEV
jgi:hypothetical protein